jgi:hypothetical protein
LGDVQVANLRLSKDVCSAIKARRVVTFRLKGESMPRIWEPYIVTTLDAGEGKSVVSGFEILEHGTAREHREWVDILFERFDAFEPGDETFEVKPDFRSHVDPDSLPYCDVDDR